MCSQSPNQALLEENRQFQSQVARHLEEINDLNLRNGVSTVVFLNCNNMNILTPVFCIAMQCASLYSHIHVIYLTYVPIVW